jgi:hypothetical protein
VLEEGLVGGTVTDVHQGTGAILHGQAEVASGEEERQE